MKAPLKYALGILACLLASVLLAKTCQHDMASNRGDYVILIHGMGRTHRAMRRMETYLGYKGYRVINLEYSSRAGTLDDLVQPLKQAIEERCPGERKIHFVTHSLGGIMVRYYLHERKEPRVGRVVMLCPPNAGSELPDIFGRLKLYEWIVGPVGLQLGTATNLPPHQLGPVEFELGVIAGDRSLNPLYSSIVEGRDDGKVSVERAKVEGMKDFLVVHSSHTFIMNRQIVLEQVSHFLENGKFEKEEKK